MELQTSANQLESHNWCTNAWHNHWTKWRWTPRTVTYASRLATAYWRSCPTKLRCEKAPCTDLRSDPTLHQNFYRTTQADAYVNHAHQTSAARVVTNLIKLKHRRVKKTVSPSTPTCWRQAPSFRSRRNMISHRETKHNKQTTKTKHKTRNRTRHKEKTKLPLLVCLMSSYVTQQLLFIKWTSDTSPSSRCLNW